MALIDITPVMTSNNAPVPYVVSSSTFFTGQEPYKAFDGVDNIANNAWVTSSGNTTGWIKLDLSMEMKCNAFSITSRSTGGISGTPPVHVGTTETPKSFKLYGSDDDLSYDLILSLENEVLWTPQETRLYNFPFEVTYRYYKIIISANNGYSSYLGIGEIKFYQDDGTTPVIENRNNSLRYTLPYGSKLRLDNLTSDLSYMLATENDGDNFGTLRVVGENGNFEMAMAGQKIRKLWGGVATTVSTLTLEDIIENYSSIVLVANYATGSGVIEGKTTQTYPVIESTGYANEFLITLSLYSGSTAKAPYIYFKMEGNQLNITAIGTGGFSQLPRLVSIYGVY